MMQDFTRPPQFGSTASQTQAGVDMVTSEALFFQKVYLWMGGGLALTTLMGYLVASSETWFRAIHTNSFLIWALIIGQFGLVMAIGFLASKVSALTIKALFLIYSAAVGVSIISLMIYVYNPQVLIMAFGLTAVVYGSMAVYGLVTKRSLQGWGSFLYMGLVGGILGMVLNFWMQSSAINYVITWVLLVVFIGLTAYDHQKLRVIFASNYNRMDSETQDKIVIQGALELYLDFLNLFLLILRLLGASRD
jgi:FtsH-binding integral membrane protein